jgi:AcrR family transcriptional regulator
MDDIAAEAAITKPTIYQYFRTRDELYCAITYPVMEDLKTDMEAMLEKISRGLYASGAAIIGDHFATYYRIFSRDPDAFRIFMLFNLTGIIDEVTDEVRAQVIDAARLRYRGMRKMYTLAMDQGLIKKSNVYQLQDLLWGAFQGIIQSLDMKNPGEKLNKNLKSTLTFAENVFIEALVLK